MHRLRWLSFSSRAMPAPLIFFFIDYLSFNTYTFLFNITYAIIFSFLGLRQVFLIRRVFKYKASFFFSFYFSIFAAGDCSSLFCIFETSFVNITRMRVIITFAYLIISLFGLRRSSDSIWLQYQLITYWKSTIKNELLKVCLILLAELGDTDSSAR